MEEDEGRSATPGEASGKLHARGSGMKAWLSSATPAPA